MAESIAEWIRNRKWQLRQLVAGEWGDDAASTVARALDVFLVAEEQNAAMYRKVRDLTERLAKYEKQAAPEPMSPGPVWTGD